MLEDVLARSPVRTRIVGMTRRHARPEAADRARAIGATVLPTRTARGLNAALTSGPPMPPSGARDGALILPADVPADPGDRRGG